MKNDKISSEILIENGFDFNPYNKIYYLFIKGRAIDHVIISIEIIGSNDLTNVGVSIGDYKNISFLPIEFNWQLLNLIRALKGEEDPVWIRKGVKYYVGDRVLVRGTRRHGEYETEIVKSLQGAELKENKTYLNDDRAFIAIIKKIN